MNQDDWKPAFLFVLMLGFITLLTALIRLNAQLTPSQASALFKIHVLVSVVLLLAVFISAVDLVLSRRKRASATANTLTAADVDSNPAVDATDVERLVSELAFTTKEPAKKEVAVEPIAPVAKDKTPAERWLELLEFDRDIIAAAEQLHPYGIQWVSALGREFLASGEDSNQLPIILARLKKQAEQEKQQEEDKRWAEGFSPTAEGERCTPEALVVLKKATTAGFSVTVDEDRTIIVSDANATSYLRSVSDIMLFGKNRLSATAQSDRRKT